MISITLSNKLENQHLAHPVGPVEIDGYTIVEARSVSKVRELLAGHPFLALGGTIQINECLDV